MAKQRRPLAIPLVRKKCVECGQTGDAREELDVCEVCRKRTENRLKVREYRKRRKADGKPDKTINSPESDAARNARKTERRKAKSAARRALSAQEAEKPSEEQEFARAADAIAAKETGAALSASERKQLSAEEAVQIELARRELARRKLAHFIKRRNPRYKDGWFSHELCEALEEFSQDVIDEKEPRLLVEAPPRHGKSMIGSEEFPAWHFGRANWHQFIGISYSAPLAYRFSRRVQDIVDSDDYRLLFPETRLKEDYTSIEEWGLTKGGVYVAAGVGGPISGKGAHVLNIDDILKNREEADSALVRRAIWDWYTSTAYTRLMPGAGVMAINTRWNYDDFMGTLIQLMEQAEKLAQETGEWPEDHDKWKVVRFPAIATHDEKYRKKGEPLHAARYSLKALLRIKTTIGDRDFNALYQQNPTPEEGEYFTKSMIRYYDGDVRMKNFTVFAAGDLAISKKEYSDWSVFVVAGINANDDIFVIDVVRGKWDSLELVDRIFEIQRRYNPVVFGLEQGQIEKAIGPFLEKRRFEERLFSLNIDPLPPGKRDKELRARPIQGRMRQGKVYIRRDAPWTDTFVTELLRFPGASKDDQVDALAWIGQMMNNVQYIPPPTTEIASWRERLESYGDHGLVTTNPAMAA
jgi:predicted phage terminase large subunit-like protein